METEIETKFIVLVIIVIVVMLLLAAFMESPNFFNPQPCYITVTKAESLEIYHRTDFTVVDTSECKCTYNYGALPRAIWCNNPAILYNETGVFLIYGENAISFCEQLDGHVIGDIYYYPGTYESWMSE